MFKEMAQIFLTTTKMDFRNIFPVEGKTKVGFVDSRYMHFKQYAFWWNTGKEKQSKAQYHLFGLPSSHTPSASALSMPEVLHWVLFHWLSTLFHPVGLCTRCSSSSLPPWVTTGWASWISLLSHQSTQLAIWISICSINTLIPRSGLTLSTGLSCTIHPSTSSSPSV